MRLPLYALAATLGIALALLGSEPLWLPAVAALLVFPASAAVASRDSDRAPLLPAVMTALAGGLLTALALRLAFAAPDWLRTTSADCGGPSTGVQQLVLWSSTLIFLLASFPVAATTLTIGRRLRSDAGAAAPSPPLALYPVSVALCGLALIAAGYVTTC